MFERLLALGVRLLVKGPAKSWIYTSAALALIRSVQKKTGRQQTVDLSRTKPGDRILIEHLPITHKEQMKQFAAEDKAAKRAAKADRKAGKRVQRDLRKLHRA